MTETEGFDTATCDGCGDRYPTTDLYELAPRPRELPADGDDSPAFTAVVCSYCVADLRREIFGPQGSFDDDCYG